jgi:hypothetical protein
MVTCTPAIPGGGPGTIPYYGDGLGAAVANFNIHATNPSKAALKIEITGLENYNAFGSYDITARDTLHQLFNGLAIAGASTVFTPSSDYGFYFRIFRLFSGW